MAFEDVGEAVGVGVDGGVADEVEAAGGAEQGAGGVEGGVAGAGSAGF